MGHPPKKNLVHPRRLTWNLRMHPWKREIIFQTIIFRCELLVSGRVQLPGKFFDASPENGVPTWKCGDEANLETHGFLGSMLSFMGGRMLKPL